MRVPQTGSEVMQLLSAAQRGHGRVKVDPHGDVVAIGRLGRIADWIGRRLHGEAWAAERDAGRDREVLEAFSAKLRRDFQATQGDVHPAQMYRRVVQDFSDIVNRHATQDSPNPSHRVMQAMLNSMSVHLGAHDQSPGETTAPSTKVEGQAPAHPGPDHGGAT